MAANGNAGVVVLDPLEQMGAAVNAPANSQEQADMLAALRDSLENSPSLATVCSSFACGFLAGPDSLLRRWALDLVHFAICKSALSTDARTKLACHRSSFLYIHCLLARRRGCAACFAEAC